MYRITALVLLTFLVSLSGCQTGHRTNVARLGDTPHAHAPHAQRSEVGHARLAAPPAIRTEHEHLHERLAAAQQAGGKTGEAARAVAEVMAPHFEEEEAYAMPPLGLLPVLARGEVTEDMRPAIGMADQLRANYEQMLEEHEQIVAALARLESAAEREGHDEHAAFARQLILHAQHEEQVLYPTTLLIGHYLRQQLGE